MTKIVEKCDLFSDFQYVKPYQSTAYPLTVVSDRIARGLGLLEL